MPSRAQTLTPTTSPAARAAPSPSAYRSPAPSAAGPAAARQSLPAEIFRAIANTPANRPAASPQQTESRRHTARGGWKAARLRYSFHCCDGLAGRRESVLVKNLPTSLALQERQESSRRLFVPCTFQDYRGLRHPRVHIRGNVPALAIFHRRGQSQRQRQDSCLRISGVHKLRRLRDVFAIHQLRAHLLVNPRSAQGSNRGASIWRMLRIGDGNFLDARVQQRCPSESHQVDTRTLWHPNHNPPGRVFIQRSRVGKSRRFELPRILAIRRQKNVKRCAVLN